MGGMRFLGVDGAPNTPWKYDWNNWQRRAGAPFQINEKTVCAAATAGTSRTPRPVRCRTGSASTTSLIASNDGGRTPTYALGNPFPNGVQQPPGSSLGRSPSSGREPELLEPGLRRSDRAAVLHRHAARAAVEDQPRSQLCRKSNQQASVRIGAASTSRPRRFQAQCDVTNGGSRSFCDQLLTNPFFNVPGFEGTTRFTSATLSRFELNRPFPEFSGCTPGSNPTSNCFTMFERNDGRLVRLGASSSRTSGGRKA